MTAAISERVELAKLCGCRDWSKAIRVLDSLLAQSCTIQDICNRAFCYSQLELHKHVVKDCDKALQLDPALLQAYILKGRAFSSLGRKEDALLVWEQGYEHALRQSADLKQLLELEELLKFAKQNRNMNGVNQVTESRSSLSTTEAVPHMTGLSSETFKKQHNLRDFYRSFNEPSSDECSKFGDNLQVLNGVNDKAAVKSPVLVSESVPQLNGKSGEVYSNHNKFVDKTNSCSKSGDTPEIDSRSEDNFGMPNNLSGKAEVGNKGDQMINGNHDIVDDLSCNSKSCNNLRIKQDLSSKSSMISSSSGDTSEICSKSSNKKDMPNEASDRVRRNKKFSVTRISKTKSITVDFRLSRGIAQVNEGKYASAISIFDQILREDPTYPEALIGRGTAYAFKRELEAAIIDFSKAIEANPLAGEAWKRRGQARAALGEPVEAIQDLTKALEFEPNSPDILHERGIVNFKFKDFDSAVEDLSTCVKFDQDNKSAYTYLGLALSPIGEYKKAEEAHLKSIQLDRSFLEGWAHLTQFYQDLANSTKALECVEKILQIDVRSAKAYHLRGVLLHGMGDHRKAIKDLSLGLTFEKSNIESFYLRGSCYHAIGEYSEAVKDYDATLDMELDSVDKFVLQCLAFYQKELALYTASKVNSEFCWFDIDGDINPLFKEYWCKRLHPKDVCEKVYRQPNLSVKRGKLRKQDFSITKQKTALLLAADSIGKKIQYDCLGFLPNMRQHRMAGLAAIEIAQKVSKAWRSLHAEWKHSIKSISKNGKRARRRINMSSQNRGGAGCSTSSSSETSTSYGTAEDRSSGRRTMSWQDVYSLAVKWRQISEPCDPVVWVNKLSEEFNSGFGSHTPLILGQAKVIRYYPNYERTLNAAKMIMKDKLYVRNKKDEVIDISTDEKLQDILDAKTPYDLYKVVGEEFWLATWCNSTAVEGKRLEGTRITVLKTGDHGFDFSIRTPCTPSRWDEFDAEMATAWETICNTYCGESYGSTDGDALVNVRDAILRMTYYWYNFMPLSRGSAAVGFIVMLGLLLAANMEFEGKIPKGVQVDWEAILNFEPSSFMDSIKSWLYESLKVTTSWKDYPDVASTLPTVGSVVGALSSFED
ncbi:Tetratricopeptide repeat (TPR)-like superfamily protein [Euphorbia peplus]|nr:Tetratricopeptide repeat (TPR)-like superfamily protein [Euphorbia peplus]